MRHWMIPLALVAGAAPLVAQGDCTLGHLPESSNEAEIFRIRGVSTAFGRAASPMALRPHTTMVLFEVTTLSTIDPATATPTYCNPGKPPENVNLMAVLPRPRVIFGLTDGFSFELSWIPPVKVNDVKANLVGVGRFLIGAAVTFGFYVLSYQHKGISIGQIPGKQMEGVIFIALLCGCAFGVTGRS